jgi:histidinol-phosphate aminotransferase
MAGLRVGALAGCEVQMKMLRKVASPYNVNSVALACIPAALQDQDFVARYVAEVVRGRQRLEATFRRLGIPYWSSQANFVLARFGFHTQGFVSAMHDRGILVRNRSSDPGCEGCVRITVGTTQQMDYLLTALEEIVSSMSKEGSLA